VLKKAFLLWFFLPPACRFDRDSGAIGNRRLQLCGRTTTGEWIRLEWPSRNSAGGPTIAVQAND
jgi:hypothetical protein